MMPEEEIQLTGLRWIDEFFEICPEDLVPFLPRLLSQVLPAISSNSEAIQRAAVKVNASLLNLVVSLADDPIPIRTVSPTASRTPVTQTTQDRRDSSKGRES